MNDPQPGSFDPDEVTERLQLSPLHRFLGFRAVRIDTDVAVLEMPIAPTPSVVPGTSTAAPWQP